MLVSRGFLCPGRTTARGLNSTADRRRRDRLDMRLELGPARKSIAAGNRMLGVREPPPVLVAPNDAQNGFGFLFQMFEIAARGQASIHHSSSCARRPLTGRKSDDWEPRQVGWSLPADGTQPAAARQIT